MITISIFNNEVLYGIDYSDREGRTKKEISMEDFLRIQNWLARYDIESGTVIDIIKPEPPEPTPEEIRELRKNEPVNIIIPMEVWDSETYYPMVKGQIENLRNNRYSEIKFRPINDDEDMEVYNIIYKDIPKFITLQGYQGYKQLWIQFHEYIEEYFTHLLEE